MSHTPRVVENFPAIPDLVLVDELGRGGQAIVYRARAGDGREVAVKVFKGSLDRGALVRFNRGAVLAGSVSGDVVKARILKPEIGERVRAALKADLEQGKFDREIRLQRALRGKGFVECLDAGVSEEGRPFLVLELLPGGSLRDRLDSPRGLMPVEAVLRLALELGRAMAHMHAEGMVHRDLKPDNVLFTSEGEPRISDLGLAKALDDDALSKTGTAKGTFAYMAPEQVADAKNVGCAADVFSLGVMLYECLTGVLPFQGVTALEIVAAAARGVYTPVREVRRETPEFLGAVIARCLKPEASERFANASELVAALERAGVSPLALGGEISGARDRPRRSPALLVGGAAALVLVLVFANLLALSLRDRNVSPSGAVEGQVPSAPRAIPAPLAAPRWYLDLPTLERAPYPLPAGVRFGEDAGVYLNEKDGSPLVFVPAGKFLMGTDDGEPSDGPRHEVDLEGFFIGRLEVTNAQFAAFMRESGYAMTPPREDKPSESAADKWVKEIAIDQKAKTAVVQTWRDPFREGAPPLTHPVVLVSWIDASAYARWAGLALPSEAQWEKAAAWDTKTRTARRYPWGDDVLDAKSAKAANVLDEAFARARPGSGDLALFRGYDDGFEKLAPVGSFPAGASPCGALDMIGNAGEWCADACDPRPVRYDEGNVVTAGKHRIARGGSWHDGPEATNQHRYSHFAEERQTFIGIRVARPAVDRR